MKNIRISLNLFLIGIFAISLLGMNDAYGIVVSTVVADDPDDADTVYSVGDTITITFDEATNATAAGTMTQTEFAANFTVSTSDIETNGDITGVWTTNAILTLTVISIAGVADPPIVGTDTIDYAQVGAGGIFNEAATIEVTVEAGPTIAGDFGLFVALRTGGSGCSGDCLPPTLGINEKYTRVVENGFTYNGNTINVERYFTPYPLITVDVGKQNKAVFKIYDNLGPDNIRHFDLAFGLDVGQTMGTSNAMIVWTKSHEGTETVTLVDPHNALDNVRVLTSEGKCKADSAGNNCLIVTVYHTFRAPLDFDMVGTNVWDYKRNAWQNFYNHGIHIEGESLNPPDEYVGIYKGDLIHIFETGKNTAVDENGNTWTFDNTWIKDYTPKGKIVDGYTQHGIDRNNAWFNIYKQGQELLANELLEQLCPACSDKEFAEIYDIVSYELPKRISKLSDPEIQNKMLQQSKVAENTLRQIFDSLYGHNQY